VYGEGRGKAYPSLLLTGSTKGKSPAPPPPPLPNGQKPSGGKYVIPGEKPIIGNFENNR
jgi:hypothetical protein